MHYMSCNYKSVPEDDRASLDTTMKKWSRDSQRDTHSNMCIPSHGTKSKTMPAVSGCQKSSVEPNCGMRLHYHQLKKHINDFRSWTNSGPLSANVTRGIDSFQGHLRPIFKYFQVKSRRIKNNLSATQLKCINPRVNENTEQDQNVTTVSSDHTASGLPEQQWHESVNPHSYGKHDVTGKLSPDYFETSIHELGDANYLGQWFPCNFGRTSSQPCFVDSERKESTETSRISTSPLLWSGPTCGSERISTWTFAPNSNAKLNSSEPVFLLGLLIQPAIYIHTSGRVKYSIQIESQKLFGLIRVKNLAYEKTVTVRCSIDKWATFVDHSASYLSPLDDIAGEREYETFAFQIPMPESASQLEFAIHYEWKLTGGRSESAWDNNGDNNYVLHNRHNCGKKRMKLIQKPYQPPTPECDNTL